MLGGMPSSWHAPMAKRSGRTDRQEMREALADALVRLRPPKDLGGVMLEATQVQHGGATVRDLSLRDSATPADQTAGVASPTPMRCKEMGPDVALLAGALEAILGDDHGVRLAAPVGHGHGRPDEHSHCAPLTSLRDNHWSARQADAHATLKEMVPAAGPEKAKVAAEHLSTTMDGSVAPRTRRAAARALSAFGASAVGHMEGKGSTALVIGLSDGNKEVREAALEAMEGTKCPANTLVRRRVRVEAESFTGPDPESVKPWSQSAQERFPPTGAQHLPPWSWSARVRRMRGPRATRAGSVTARQEN